MKKNMKGFTLIELVIFIVVSSIAMVGVLSVFQHAGRRTAESIEQSKFLDAANMLMEEVQLMPYTYCDPSDSAALTATSTASCTVIQGMGATSGQVRGGAVPFNHVQDYAGYNMSPPTDINGNTIVGLESYQFTVAVSNVALQGIASSDVLKITITGVGPYGTFTLTGYRTRFDPNGAS